MTFLETKTIKAPTLYKTNTTAVTEFNSVMETIKAERTKLTAQQNQALQRNGEIPNEIHKLKQSLSETLKQAERDFLRSSIETLEVEHDQVLETLSLNVSETIGDKMAALGIEGLKNQAATEHLQSAKEIAAYLSGLTAAYEESRTMARGLLDRNRFKKTETDFENMKRYLSIN